MVERQYQRPSGKVRRAFDLPASLAHRLRVVAAERGESQSEIVERAIRRELERMGQATTLARQLNEAIRAVFTDAGARWAPDTGDGLWVEERDGQLYLCDHGTAAPLAEQEAAVEYVEQAAREWIEATGARPEHECDICSAAGQVSPATRYAVGRWLCETCAAQYERYLRPGERLEDMTQEEIDRRIYSDPVE